MTEKLTSRQEEILGFIQQMQQQEGRPPTRADICQAFGFRSPNAAESHLRALAAKGAILLEEGRARGIRLKASLGLPLIGRVAAGNPILAEQNIEEYYQINPDSFSPAADYLLRVRGMSMRDAGILDNDLLAIARCHEARNGQIVVARVYDEVTVKTLRITDTKAELLPANPDFEPIVINTRHESLEIEGIVVGLIRQDGFTMPH